MKTAACRAAAFGWFASLNELGQQALSLDLLLVVALVQNFLEDFTRTFDVAHFLVRLGEIELGRRVVPLTVEHGRGWIFERRALRIEREIELVELDRGSRSRQLRRGGSRRRKRGLGCNRSARAGLGCRRY